MRSIRSLFTALVVLIAGIALIVVSAGEMMDYSKTGEDFSQLTISDIKEGMMIEGDLPYNYGSYEYIKKEKDKEGFGYYYLIGVNGSGFMGLYTAVDDLIEQLDAQYDDLFNATAPEDIDNVAPVHFKGKVTKMDSEDVNYYRTALTDDIGMDDDSIDEYCLELYIKCVDTSSHPFILIIGIVCTVAGLVLMFFFIRRKIMGR